MSSTDRRDSRELRHQHSASADHGRALVPMWDSSDPERAPPPLPLNPSSPKVATSRSGTSSAIANAHAALTQKARENDYIINSPPPKRPEFSPERLLMKGTPHKRMQSTGNVLERKFEIEGASMPPPPKSPEKKENSESPPLTPKDAGFESKSPEKASDRPTTPTPSSRNTLSVRPSLLHLSQSIWGENSPPRSAVMQALRDTPSRDNDQALTDVTNGSNAVVRSSQSFDGISTQILSLTGIATNLQREMAQLSRRSKDNATDLLSLKEATNARDEDIRKSLRELVNGLSESSSRSSSTLYGNGGLLLDNKPHNSPGSRETKNFTLPRFPSPSCFSASLDRESAASPLGYSVESPANIALLEKILRDMGTKEGQDLLVQRLNDLANSLAEDGASTSKKLDHLESVLKEYSGSQALILREVEEGREGRSRNLAIDESSGLGSMVSRVESLLASNANGANRSMSETRTAGVLNEDFLKLLHTVKDSVSQGGGLTAEVKALVRELRGEVLGMGREIGRKLDQGSNREADDVDEKERVASIVREGLEDLKEHMDRVLRENRRQSSSSSVSRSTLDEQDVYNAVKAAMSEIPQHQNDPVQPALDRSDVVDAVKEAWENYRPDIEVQHFGLEREELLACLREGIQEYLPQETAHEPPGASREEVFAAVVEGLKHFSPPKIETEASITREEILDAVRECLEEFEFPAAEPAPLPDRDVMRDDVLEAVKEGLNSFEFATKREELSLVPSSRSLTRDEVLSAVQACLADTSGPIVGYGDQVLGRVQEIMDAVREGFEAVSDEARQNVSAHGRDTEQVLDATKDGLEKLRADIESYVDRASGIEEQEEMLASMNENLESLRSNMEALIAQASNESVDAIKGEFEAFKDMMTTSIVSGSVGADKEELLGALQTGFSSLRAEMELSRPNNESSVSSNDEILEALQDGISGLKLEVEKVGNKPVDMTVNYEILDTLKAGLEGVRADIDRLREESSEDREVASINDGAIVPVEALRRNDIEHLEILITQLRIKVEAMESMSSPPSQALEGSLSKEDFAGVEASLRDVQESLEKLNDREHDHTEAGTSKEDLEALETLLRNTKARLDEIDPEQMAKKDHLDCIELAVRETRDVMGELALQFDEFPKMEDVSTVTDLVKDIVVSIDAMKEQSMQVAERVEVVTKADVQAIEAMCLEFKSQIDHLLSDDLKTLSSKDDVRSLEEMIKEFKTRIETHAESNTKAFEEMQAETVGVGERVNEVMTFLEEFKDALKEKLDNESTGIENLEKSLGGIEAAVGHNEAMAESLKDLSETVKTEFEKSHAGVVGAKLESDEQFQKTWDKVDEKLDEVAQFLSKKYDESQVAAEDRDKAGDERATEVAAALQESKVIAEDLKLLVDTLGTTMTDSVEKLDEGSKTVFNRVEDTFGKLEDTRSENQTQHEHTREEVAKALSHIESLQGHVTGFHPEILESLKVILQTVEQHHEHSKEHYEHSKNSVTALQDKIAEIPSTIPPVEIPMLPPPEKPDHSELHEKLDKLVDHTHKAEDSFAQFAALKEIQDRVTELVSLQQQRITQNHDDIEKAAAEASIALEKRVAQREAVEAEIVGAQETLEQSKHDLTIVKAETNALNDKKCRLAAEVSGLETALQLRREELLTMEARAESLERRIMDGIIDHSRAAAMASKTRDPMSLRRVSGRASSGQGTSMLSSTLIGTTSNLSSNRTTASRLPSKRSQIAQDPLVMALNKGAPGSRRVHSLNPISINVPNGASGFQQPIKRSHSVKTPKPTPSFRPNLRMRGSSVSEMQEGEETETETEDDTENSVVLHEAA